MTFQVYEGIHFARRTKLWFGPRERFPTCSLSAESLMTHGEHLRRLLVIIGKNCRYAWYRHMSCRNLSFRASLEANRALGPAMTFQLFNPRGPTGSPRSLFIITRFPCMSLSGLHELPLYIFLTQVKPQSLASHHVRLALRPLAL